MNILIISHMYPNSSNAMNGIFVHKQICALKKLYGDDIKVKVISPVPYTPYILSKLFSKYKGYYNIPEYTSIDGIDVYYPRVLMPPKNIGFKYSGNAFYHGMRKIADKLNEEEKFDLIHAHVALPDGYGAVLLNENYKIPLVITVHGQDINYTVGLGKAFESRVFKTIDAASAVIFVSSKLKNKCQALYKPMDKFKVINNGVDTDINLRQDRLNELREEYKGKRIILSTGNLLKPKGHDLTIKAFAKLSSKYDDIILLIIGKGEEYQNLKDLCKKYNISRKVIFLNQLPHEEVLYYMEICYMFVLPSWKEGFGIVYIEAMSRGKCVIGCKGEGIEDVVINNVNGVLAEPKDVNDLEIKMDKLLSNDDVVKKIGDNAKMSVLKEFTWYKSAEKLYKLYLEVLKYEGMSYKHCTSGN